ncbi:geminin coiled-coil domain-containing protein 1 isoform X3 [Sceloporus undulatus]|uniref:geminin coiled-coil domain-containing protein 1 isoform X3 n=1 Tax=Sceloporus undulatus TaxID=8520 RepID=UPI001C4D2003|nr:geminin coiled-coil domain-containing protein 1 isoform X3 [Sceloporus undulatus]XP_042312117.1 geminin coiled-coil domain-containing protein 1 isoform X3 [Sceloporus undulatus]
MASLCLPNGFCSLETTLQEDVGTCDQLCTQLYRNKQLQDTLLQKEEELARLQEENNHLRQFLNSALVKQLEEKTKKLLLQNGCGVHQPHKACKRRMKMESSLQHEASHPQKARRNLLASFSACEEHPHHPPVDTWVLRTLGLKDLDTIDDESSSPANYSALTLDLPPEPSFLRSTLGMTDYDIQDGQPAGYPCAELPATESPETPRKMSSLSYLPPLPTGPCHPLLTLSHATPLPGIVPCSPETISPTQMDMAFTASLSPHCNVKTHTFRQGQAFVRRDEDGGWKLTWVPKEPE